MKKFWLIFGMLFALHSQAQQLVMADTGTNETSAGDAVSVQKWAELTDQQRQVLAPLAKEWDTLRTWQREKMLDIAKDYPKMGAKKAEASAKAS